MLRGNYNLLLHIAQIFLCLLLKAFRMYSTYQCFTIMDMNVSIVDVQSRMVNGFYKHADIYCDMALVLLVPLCLNHYSQLES